MRPRVLGLGTSPSASSRGDATLDSSRDCLPSSASNLSVSTPSASVRPLSPRGGRAGAQDLTTSDFEHLLASVMRSYETDESPSAQQLSAGPLDWMNCDQTTGMHDESPAAMLLSLGHRQDGQETRSYSIGTNGCHPGDASHAEATLQERIQRICTTPLQLEAVSRCESRDDVCTLSHSD